MVDITAWMEQFLCALDKTFASRVWFVGLQGSYGRGEATKESDIDVVVILDALQPSDVILYRKMLDTLAHREKICGFFAGKEELLAWEPSDLVQFYHDTKPIRGSLDALLPLLTEEVAERAIKIGACNIYHSCVHNMLHARSEETLKALYKSAAFVIRAVVYRQSGQFIHRTADLRTAVTAEDEMVIEALPLVSGGIAGFEVMSSVLLLWAQKKLNEKAE